MKNKKLVTIALTTAFAMGISAPVFAEVSTPIAVPPVAPAAVADQKLAVLVTTVGTVQEINADDQYPTILVKNDQTEIEFYINSDTWLVDGSGVPAALTDLQGKEVVVSHSQAMTMSIPAKCSAKAVMLRGDVAPNYAVIEAVSKNADGSVTFTTDKGSRLITAGKDAVVTPFKTRNLVSLDMLKAGDEVVLYYDVMALSFPAQAHTDRVVLLHPADATAETTTPNTMVSLRDAATELGMAIDWNAETQVAILSQGAFNVTVTIGSVDYGINRMLVKLDQAAELRDGRTYVPQALVDAIKAQRK